LNASSLVVMLSSIIHSRNYILSIHHREIWSRISWIVIISLILHDRAFRFSFHINLYPLSWLIFDVFSRAMLLHFLPYYELPHLIYTSDSMISLTKIHCNSLRDIAFYPIHPAEWLLLH
jgi:hypothetical protein